MKAWHDEHGRLICFLPNDSILLELQEHDRARAEGIDLYDVAIATASGRPINTESLARRDRLRAQT